MTWKPTKVQQDVIDRMKDGWTLIGWGDYQLVKDGEPSRHVATVTVDSLWGHGVLKLDGASTRRSYRWTLAQ